MSWLALKRIYCGFLLAGVLLFTAPLLAGERAEPEADFRVATYQQSATVRLYQRFVAEAYHRLGYTVVFDEMSPRRGVYALGSGAVDALLMATPDVESTRNRVIRVQEALPASRFELLALAVFPRDSLPDDFGSYRLGHMQGIQPLERWLKDQETETVNRGFDQLLSLLLRQRVDVIAVPAQEVDGLIARSEQPLRPLLSPVLEVDTFHYLRGRHKQLAPELAGAIRQLKRERCFERLTRAMEAGDLDKAEPLCRSAGP